MTKAQPDVEKEIELLRQQVVALTAARESKAAEPPAEEPADPAGEARPDRLAALSASGLTEQLEDLVGHLKRDIEETPTATCLAIFTLGLLLGRALAR